MVEWYDGFSLIISKRKTHVFFKHDILENPRFQLKQLRRSKCLELIGFYMELDLPGSVGIIAPHRDTSSGYLSANQKKKIMGYRYSWWLKKSFPGALVVKHHLRMCIPC